MADKKKSGGPPPDFPRDIERDSKSGGVPTPHDAERIARSYGDKKTVENVRKIQSVRRGREMDQPPEYKTGGRVKKTGRARLHKGEAVIKKRRRSGRD